MKRNWLISLVVVIAILLISLPVFAAAPDEPPGLEKALAAQAKHENTLFRVAGVEGVGVGLNENNQPAVIIFTQNPGVRGLPASLDGVPVNVQVSGKFIAQAAPPKKVRNNPPVVKINSPIDGATYSSEASILFQGTANDQQQGDMTSQLAWTTDGNAIPGGTGGSFTAVLDDGLHTIVASVKDSGGLTGSASITINVGSPQNPTVRWSRPVPIGVSTGHPNITAGTIGARVTDGTNVYALSNNHVYADENNAGIGDNVLQPGRYDGGVNPADAFATLYKFRPIVFSMLANNDIDAAIALTSVSNLDKATPSGGYGTPRSTPATAFVGMQVQKYGRTTRITQGQVYAVNTSVNVTYDSGTARFVRQIVITPGTFSAGGDSGSLIVGHGRTYDRQPVGLLFAGSSSYTIANPIQSVLAYFGVTIDGEQ